MRIVFMGTPDFAVPTLDILVKNKYEVVAVITSPDKPAGRGQQVQQSAVKQHALAQGLRVLQPERLKDETFLTELRNLKADLQVVVAFRMLPEIVWNMPPLGTYNLHASILPQYRGAAPINWAIINGEAETGLTTFKLQQEIDTGSILFQEKINIQENDNAGSLHNKLMHSGAALMLKTLKTIESGSYTLVSQQELIAEKVQELKHAPKIFKENCKINWNKSPGEIHNLIRGLSPYPAAWTEFEWNGQRQSFKIFSSEKENINHNHSHGQIFTDSKTYLKVACEAGFIKIHELQLAGKKRLSVQEFLKGSALKQGFLLL